jgi:hypothetical protein
MTMPTRAASTTKPMRSRPMLRVSMRSTCKRGYNPQVDRSCTGLLAPRATETRARHKKSETPASGRRPLIRWRSARWHARAPSPKTKMPPQQEWRLHADVEAQQDPQPAPDRGSHAASANLADGGSTNSTAAELKSSEYSSGLLNPTTARPWIRAAGPSRILLQGRVCRAAPSKAQTPGLRFREFPRQAEAGVDEKTPGGFEVHAVT